MTSGVAGSIAFSLMAGFFFVRRAGGGGGDTLATGAVSLGMPASRLSVVAAVVTSVVACGTAVGIASGVAAGIAVGTVALVAGGVVELLPPLDVISTKLAMPASTSTLAAISGQNRRGFVTGLGVSATAELVSVVVVPIAAASSGIVAPSSSAATLNTFDVRSSVIAAWVAERANGASARTS